MHTFTTVAEKAKVHSQSNKPKNGKQSVKAGMLQIWSSANALEYVSAAKAKQ